MNANSPSRRYLLVAGTADVHGRRSDLVGAYDDEEAARAAFIALRLERQRREDWAQLASVPAEGRARMLCWFGENPDDRPDGPAAPPAPTPLPAPPPVVPTRTRPRLFRRSRARRAQP